MEDHVRDFLLMEVPRLRDETLESLKQTWNLERLAVIATAAVWAWCLTNIKTPGFVILTPALIVVLAGFRCIGLQFQMLRLGKYIKRVEKTFSLPDGLGWESSALNDRFRVFVGFAFWIILVAVTVAVPLLYGNQVGK